MKKFLVLALMLTLIFAATYYAYRVSIQPHGDTSSTMTIDPCFTGGVYCSLNPDVTQGTIDKTICVSGWTGKIRPPVSYTNKLKRDQLGPGEDLTMYEEDHRMPLEMGGHPTDKANLSPERYPEAYAKDHAENQGKADICSHKVTLAQAQTTFIQNWLANYPNYK